MRKRLLPSLGVLALLLAGGYLLLWLTVPGWRPDRMLYERLRRGMTEADVERLLGPPAEADRPAPGEKWSALVWQQGKGMWEEPVLLTRRWQAEDGTILVAFGAERTVVDYSFRDSPGADEGVLARLRRWLGIAR